MSRELTLMRDVICQYHPDFVVSRDLRRFGLKNPTIFNVERLIEESLAAVGNMRFVDAEGYDFEPDYSDSKTCTVNARTRVGQINSVEAKVGALRVTVYNPVRSGLDYFYIPKRDVQRVKKPCYGISEHKERIQFTYSVKGNYGTLADFQVRDFVELSQIRG